MGQGRGVRPGRPGPKEKKLPRARLRKILWPAQRTQSPLIWAEYFLSTYWPMVKEKGGVAGAVGALEPPFPSFPHNSGVEGQFRPKDKIHK